MSAPGPEFTVFTKPWRLPLPDLARFVRGLGFSGVELPVRPGYQVEPETVELMLPLAARTLAEHGLRIDSVAGPTDLRTIAACAEAGVRLIRVCIGIPAGAHYLEHEQHVREEFERLVPALDRHGVAIGVQNHSDRSVGSAIGVRHLIEHFDPRHIGAVWDPAHCALAGEPPALAADILWSHLALVNLKNAVWERHSPPDAPWARHRHLWLGGREGLCPWPEVAAELGRRGYTGPICLTAEYSDPASVDRQIAADLAFARSLFPAVPEEA